MGKEYRVDAVPVNNVIDTTGCGDSYHAGFLCSYLRDCDIIKAINEGSRVAWYAIFPVNKKGLQINRCAMERDLKDMTKVMNPDKTKVLICYGGLRVDGCSLIVQTAISRWESLYSFESPEAAVDALKTITEAIEQRVSLIEL